VTEQEGSRVVRPGDVPPADYARIRLQMGVAVCGGRWGFDSRMSPEPAGLAELVAGERAW
jgi:hypothetical protein